MREQDYDYNYFVEERDEYYPKNYPLVAHKRTHYFEYDEVEGDIYDECEYGYED